MAAVCTPGQNDFAEISDLQNDPFKTNNALINQNILCHSKMHYLFMMNRGRETAPMFVVGENSNPVVDSELKDELKALGYIR